MQPDTGDRVLVTRGKERFEGILLQSMDPAVVLLKLDSGYNIGIRKQGAKLKLVRQFEAVKKKAAAKQEESPDLPRVTILHTGGTIASRVDYATGAVVAKFTPEDVLELIPELKTICRVRSVFVANVQSESMRFGHYNLIAKAIEKEIAGREKPKGIIITHGTDTLHYSAAALAFMLGNIDVPVILVGAQRSSDRGSSDAAVNVTCAARFIVKTDFAGVAICMHRGMGDELGVILPACKSRKLHTSRRDAFKAVNAGAIAEVAYREDVVRFLRDDYYRPGQGKLAVKLFKETINVGLLKTHTNTYPGDYLHFKDYKGLVIEGTGLGHAQTTGFDRLSAINEKNKKALAKVCEEAIVVMCSQCIFGRVNMNVYSPQRELLEIGVIGGEDMTAETAFIKLAWLLSNYPKEEAKKLMAQNLRGEITGRTIPEDDVLA